MRLFEKMIKFIVMFVIRMTIKFTKKVYRTGIAFGTGSLTVVYSLFTGSFLYLSIGIGLIGLHFVMKAFKVARSVVSFIILSFSIFSYIGMKVLSNFVLNETILTITQYSLIAMIVTFFVLVTSRDINKLVPFSVFSFKKIIKPSFTFTIDQLKKLKRKKRVELTALNAPEKQLLLPAPKKESK